jgi:cytochrome c-type biogenesis protein CcmE
LPLWQKSVNTKPKYKSTEVAQGKAPIDRSFRLGGMVAVGSFKREDLKSTFDVTDYKNKFSIEYTGILPDLFREGQGIITTGSLVNGRFIATEVLAKHDENYMPPEVADALKPKRKLLSIGALPCATSVGE